jgi:anion-transporting  ArsA/GET3 family ATPase
MAPRGPATVGGDARLIIVTGKGGVGKSTIAAALGVAAARDGLETLVAEVAGRSDIVRALDTNATSGGEEQIAPGLWHVSIEARTAMDDYLRNEVPGRVPGAILTRSRSFDVLAMATPGLRELVTIGKVWELTQRPRRRPAARPYDRVILDAPATGHAVALLSAPRTFAAIARIGPMARQAARIDGALRAAAFTRIVAVAAPEQMAVSETLALEHTLGRELGVGFGAVIMNRMLPYRFTAADMDVLQRLADDPAVRAARTLAARARAQRAQLARLRRGVKAAGVTTLPFLVLDKTRRESAVGLAEALAHRLR